MAEVGWGARQRVRTDAAGDKCGAHVADPHASASHLLPLYSLAVSRLLLSQYRRHGGGAAHRAAERGRLAGVLPQDGAVTAAGLDLWVRGGGGVCGSGGAYGTRSRDTFRPLRYRWRWRACRPNSYTCNSLHPHPHPPTWKSRSVVLTNLHVCCSCVTRAASAPPPVLAASSVASSVAVAPPLAAATASACGAWAPSVAAAAAAGAEGPAAPSPPASAAAASASAGAAAAAAPAAAPAAPDVEAPAPPAAAAAASCGCICFCRRSAYSATASGVSSSAACRALSRGRFTL